VKRIAPLIVAFVSVLTFTCAPKKPVNVDELVKKAEFSDGEIVLPEVCLDSDDAEKANEELKKLYESWQQWRSEGINISSSYATALRNGILSLRVIEVFNDGIVDDSRYYTYMFNIESGRAISYGEFLELFGITQDHAEFYVMLAYAKAAFELGWDDESFLPYQTLRGSMSQTKSNFADSAESEVLSYFFDETGTPYVSVMFITPEGAQERAVPLFPSDDASTLLLGDWLLDAGDAVYRLSFEAGGRMTARVTDAEGLEIQSFSASYKARPEGTELVLEVTGEMGSFEARLSGTFVYQFIVLPGDGVPLAPGEYTYEEPERSITDYYELY